MKEIFVLDYSFNFSFDFAFLCFDKSLFFILMNLKAIHHIFCCETVIWLKKTLRRVQSYSSVYGNGLYLLIILLLQISQITGDYVSYLLNGGNGDEQYNNFSISNYISN